MQKRLILPLILILNCFVAGCLTDASKGKQQPTSVQIDYKLLGDSISLEAQKALMTKLINAINESGVDYAASFCSVHAISLTDSISEKFNCAIQRVAERNRNPANKLTTREDLTAFSIFSDAVGQKQIPSATVFDSEKVAVYYKPILLAMPDCLKCHGKEGELDASALAIISKNYPDDKATGFSLGDLRGMWKITFKK